MKNIEQIIEKERTAEEFDAKERCIAQENAFNRYLFFCSCLMVLVHLSLPPSLLRKGERKMLLEESLRGAVAVVTMASSGAEVDWRRAFANP